MLINYLPKFLADIEEIKAIMDSCQGNIDNIEIELDNILKDLFVKDATLNGIERYENMLDILPKLTDSLEIRKANILLKYNQTLPFTLENLILMLNSVCGENNYTIKIIYEEFKINIRINLDKKELENEIFEFLDRIVPANMLINLDLDYNIWEHINAKTWGYIQKFRWIDVRESNQIREDII